MNECGFYQVGDNIFHIKNRAVYESICTKSPMSWNFHDDIFANFKKTQFHNLGKIPLDDWYKLRAQQLRDEYDYLILNYSGGPDSHNILATFLRNKIHLDEIHVKYSHSVDSKIYSPTNQIKSAENIHSEYDLVIKPVLEQLTVTNPEIKISIHDIFETGTNILEDETFLASGHFTGAFELFRQQQYSKTIDTLSEKGKKVADIFGVDKPLLVYKDKCLYTFFSDAVVNTAGNRHMNKSNASVELFYWTPDMPQIAMEQAYAHYLHFKKNPSLLSLIDYNTVTPYDPIRLEMIRQLSINLIYTTWDHSKFQAEKSVYYSQYGRSRDKYYINHKEFQKYLQIYNYHASAWSSVAQSQNSKTFYSPWINIGYLDV